MEEPENGIHPEKISAILDLLQDICTDISQPVGDDNPLRQVIINTHSPGVVQLVSQDSLLLAESKGAMAPTGVRYRRVVYSPLPNTWRTKIDGNSYKPVSLGRLLGYLLPTKGSEDLHDVAVLPGFKIPKRVKDRSDIQDVQHKASQLSILFGADV